MVNCLAITVDFRLFFQYLVSLQAFDENDRWKIGVRKIQQHEVAVLRGDRADIERHDLCRHLAFFGELK